jgi:cytochrome c-type biogenesis protein CcmH
MDPRVGFVWMAGAMTALALAFALPARSSGRAWPEGRSRVLVAGIWLGLPGAALALYALLGDFAALSPSRSELAQASKVVVQPDLPDGALYDELERHLSRQPDDARALVMKARLDMQADRFDLAAAGYEKALSGSSKATRDADVWLEYAEAVGMAQAGVLAGKPRQLIDKALSLAPDNPKALDLAGSAALEQGEHRAALMHWHHLLEQMPPASARHRELSRAIEGIERSEQGKSPARANASPGR